MQIKPCIVSGFGDFYLNDPATLSEDVLTDAELYDLKGSVIGHIDGFHCKKCDYWFNPYRVEDSMSREELICQLFGTSFA